MEIKLLADPKEQKPCLVLYQALNCLLKHSIRLFEISSLRTGETIDKDVDKEIKKIIEYYGTK